MLIKRKIGILTYHYKDNFGALLQCYALQEYLKQKGFDAEVINFKPQKNIIVTIISIIKNQLVYTFKNFKINHLLIYFKQFKALYVQTKKFNLFREKYLNISELFDANQRNHDLNKYEVIITGSDQIWNSIDGFYDAYFLIPFVSFNGKRLSYAACRGVKEVKEKDLIILKKALEDYYWVGVRDNQTQEFVHTTSEQKADVVCDPSMLIDFNHLLVTKSPIKFKYIFVYILGKEIEGGHLKMIKEIKNKFGDLKVVACYLTNKNPNYFSWADIHLFDSSPIEWMNLIKYAEFFYTDSFHGVLFANKFERNFLAYYSEKIRSSRLLDISERLDLSKNIVSSYEEAIEKGSIYNNNDRKNYKIKSEKFVSDSKELLLKKIESKNTKLNYFEN